MKNISKILVGKNSFKGLRRVAVLMLSAVLAGSLFSCSKSSLGEAYYVVGYSMFGVVIQKGTAKSPGYLLISEKNKDLLLDENLMKNISSGSLDNLILLTNRNVDENGTLIDDPFDGIIDFPEESMPNLTPCGRTLFREEYRFEFKVHITYRPMTELEARAALVVHPAHCATQLSSYSHEQYNKIVIKSIANSN